MPRVFIGGKFIGGGKFSAPDECLRTMGAYLAPSLLCAPWCIGACAVCLQVMLHKASASVQVVRNVPSTLCTLVICQRHMLGAGDDTVAKQKNGELEKLLKEQGIGKAVAA